MAITVGLDFGTHQTKICVENSDDPQHKTYEFFTWGDGNIFLPSIIQVNKDNTITYGSCDLSTCLYAKKRKIKEKPQEIKYPNEPILLLSKPVAPKYPEEPVKTILKSDGMVLQIPISKLYGIDDERNENKSIIEYEKWERKCRKLNRDYEERYKLWREFRQKGLIGKLSKPKRPIMPPKPTTDIEDTSLMADNCDRKKYILWKNECLKIEKQYNEELEKYECAIREYEEKYNKWKADFHLIERKYNIENEAYERSIEELPMIFRYFKQATFSYYNWDYELKSEMLSVWYLAYIIFLLEKKYGNMFSIQMGIPASSKTHSKLKLMATTILIQAYRLVEDVFKNDMEKFLATKYQDLIELTPKPEYSNELKMEYGIIILPEAYASLRSVTTNGRIPQGMNMMFDVGGGTTDLSFFVIEQNGEPHIYHYNSIPKGLNYFLEYDIDKRSYDVSIKRELDEIPITIFRKAQKDYIRELESEINYLIKWLHLDTIIRGFDKKAFASAIKSRPLVYSGGGSIDRKMRVPISPFNDVKCINSRILHIPNLVGGVVEDRLLHILVTAYGLSIASVSDDIEISSKEELFAEYDNNAKYWEGLQDYNLRDDW